MKPKSSHYDAIVIGSGPAGQNAALEAASHGARTLIIERELEVGGACVQYGTIPSKTLRETATTLSSFRRRSGDVYRISNRQDLQVESLMSRLHCVIEAHQKTTQRYLDVAGVERVHGHAEFSGANEIQIRSNSGEQHAVNGEKIFIATGSRPRNPPEVPIDHENILDSDSVLSIAYLPRSIVVLGAGVIACEYASVMACLGVETTIIDRHAAPMGFLDADLVEGFLKSFNNDGGRFIGGVELESIVWDEFSQVITTLSDGQVIESDKALVALGRQANTDRLGLEDAGLAANSMGLLTVDSHFQTSNPAIFAIGDCIGRPALASASLHQGRAAARYAFGIEDIPCQSLTPIGIYSIPEIASVGLDENQAARDGRSIRIGRANFQDLARGQIMAANGGLVKLIADEHGRELLGVQIFGDGATELVHVGQMAIISGMTIDQVATTNFNFPTMAEAYRMAALDVICSREDATADEPLQVTGAI